MVGSSSTSLQIKPRYVLWFLKPTDPASGPADDTVIDGDVTLTLAAAKQVKRIDVEFIGTQTMTIHGKYVAYPTVQRKLTINPCEDSGTLSKGQHTFAWSFIAPANTAPVERLGEFQADVRKEGNAPHGGNVRARTKHKIRVTAHGCGLFGSALVEETEVYLQAITNRGEWGIAQGFNRVEELLHPELGPLRAQFFTRFLLIYGFLRLSLALPEMAEDCEIVDVAVILVQNVQLRNLAQADAPVEERPPFSIKIWTLAQERQGLARTFGPSTSADRIAPAESVPAYLKKGEAFQLTRNMRLPNDNTIRQSTSAWSETGVRVSHSLALELSYRSSADVKAREIRALRIKYDVHISSCDCTLENLGLPDYLRASLPQEKSKPGCLCMVSEYVSEHELEKVYGMNDLKDSGDFLGGSGEGRVETFVPGQQPLTKWEQELAADQPGGSAQEEERQGQDVIDELMR